MPGDAPPPLPEDRYHELCDLRRLVASEQDDARRIAAVPRAAARMLCVNAAALVVRKGDGLVVSAAAGLSVHPAELAVRDDTEVAGVLATIGRTAGFELVANAPVRLRGATIGWLAVYAPPRPALSPQDHELLQALADEAAVALALARVTDEDQAAATALRDSEELFRLALEGAPTGIALVGLDGRFLRVNDALCEIVGYPPDELRTLTFQAITHPDDLDTDLALAERLAKGEIPRYQLNKRYIRKDGTSVEILLHGSVARDAAGAPRYFIAHIEDVSESKLAEERLRKTQERLDLALKGADLAAWDWNIATGEVVYSARWAEMRGYRLDEIKPHVETWVTGVHPDDFERVQRELTDYLEGRSPEYSCEHRVRTKSGSWIWSLDRGKVFARDAAGNPIRMVGTELDITERKHLEQSLRDAKADLDLAQSVAKTGSWRLDTRLNLVVWSSENNASSACSPGRR